MMKNAFDRNKGVLTQYLENAKTVFEDIDNKSMVRRIDAFLEDFRNLRYTLTIVGSLKRGKSTLLNALMGRSNDDISPIGDFVCTSAIIRYTDKDHKENPNPGKEQAVVSFENGTENVVVPLSELRSYVTENANPGNRKQVRSIEVFGTFPNWGKSVRIVDTPGQNSVYDYHDILLTDFLPSSDAILCLVSADIPLDGGDLKLLKALNEKQRDRLLFVVTKWDELAEDEREETLDYIRDNLNEAGFGKCPIFTVAARLVYEAVCRNESEAKILSLKSQWGLSRLEDAVAEIVSKNSAEAQWLMQRVRVIMSQVKESTAEYREQYRKLLERSTISRAELDSERYTLEEANKELRAKTDQALRKFSREWERKLHSIERIIDSKKDSISDEIVESIHKMSLVKTLFKGFNLKEEVSLRIRDRLTEILEAGCDEFSAIAETLQTEMDEELNLYVKRLGLLPDLVTEGGSLVGFAALGGVVATAGSFAWPATTALAGIIHGVIIGTEHLTTGLLISDAAVLGTWSAIGLNCATLGASLAATVVGAFVAKKAMVIFQTKRVPKLAESAVDKIKETCLPRLDAFKSNLIEAYMDNVNQVIDGNKDRLDEIERLLGDEASDERVKIQTRSEKLDRLMEEGRDAEADIVVD